MQHIGLIREDERGNILAEFDANGIDLRIIKATPKDSVCLRFIDSYGDLVINQLQLPVLVRELQQIRHSCSDRGLQENIDRLIVFLTEDPQPHVYFRFCGD